MKTVKRVVVDKQGLKMVRDVLIGREIWHISGHASIFVPSTRTKWLLLSKAAEWPDANGELVPMTPGEAARHELARAFPDIKRVGWPGPMVKLFDWRWPMACQVKYRGGLAHFDLISAYHQIYKYLWLDTPFVHGYGTLRLAPVADRLKDWKAARNAVIGIIRSRHAIGVRGREHVKLHTENRFLSPGLWAAVQAVLHALAQTALDCGAIYVATDGYTFPHFENHNLFTGILDTLGLKYRSEYGPGEVCGWLVYQRPGKTTHLFKNGIRDGRLYNNIAAYKDKPWRTLQWMEKCKELAQVEGVKPR